MKQQEIHLVDAQFAQLKLPRSPAKLAKPTEAAASSAANPYVTPTKQPIDPGKLAAMRSPSRNLSFDRISKVLDQIGVRRKTLKGDYESYACLRAGSSMIWTLQSDGPPPQKDFVKYLARAQRSWKKLSAADKAQSFIHALFREHRKKGRYRNFLRLVGNRQNNTVCRS